MPDPTPNPAQSSAAAEPTDDVRVLIDQLMAQPPKGLPQIIVIGDDAVSGINPLPRRPAPDA